LDETRSIIDIEFLLVNVRGFFRDLVLYTIAKLGKAYGYAIRRFISQNMRIYVPSSGILYPTLHELEKEGLLKSSTEGKRRVYMLTEKGCEYLSIRIESIEKMIRKISRTIELMEYVGFKELFETLKKLWELEVEPPKPVLDAIKVKIMEINAILSELLRSPPTSTNISNPATSTP
jgi:DNA-binding PadR family transcriptional regulator